MNCRISSRTADSGRARAEYDVRLAQRRYEAADPNNRLVAGELEARWEQSLRDQQQLERKHQEFLVQQDAPAFGPRPAAGQKNSIGTNGVVSSQSSVVSCH